MIVSQRICEGTGWGPLVWRALLREVGLDPLAETVPLAFGPYLWTAALLAKVRCFNSEQTRLLMQELRSWLLAAGRQLECGQQIDSFLLVFIDGRYAIWPGRREFLDLETGDNCEQLPLPAMESLSYNLVELFRRERLRCGQAGPVCDRRADPVQ